MLNFLKFMTIAVVELLEETGVGCAQADRCCFKVVVPTGWELSWPSVLVRAWALSWVFMPGYHSQTLPLVMLLFRKRLYFNFLIPL